MRGKSRSSGPCNLNSCEIVEGLARPNGFPERTCLRLMMSSGHGADSPRVQARSSPLRRKIAGVRLRGKAERTAPSAPSNGSLRLAASAGFA